MHAGGHDKQPERSGVTPVALLWDLAFMLAEKQIVLGFKNGTTINMFDYLPRLSNRLRPTCLSDIFYKKLRRSSEVVMSALDVTSAT